MGLVLAAEGKLRQTETFTCCRRCVKGNAARAGALDDGKQTKNGAIG